MVLGPTACGKSRFAFEGAEELNAEILNLDSLQVYKSLDIGTSKPPLSERQSLPHHLFDVVSEGLLWTAADFARAAKPLLTERLKERPLIGVGGSGFYIQALEKGMYEMPKTPPEVALGLETELRESGLQHLYEELLEKDPQYAQKISSKDSYRIQRALAVLRMGGGNITQIQKKFEEKGKSEFPWATSKMGLVLERSELLPLVRSRADSMLKQGLIEEVEGLLKKGLDTWSPLNSVGYKEVRAFLRGEIKKSDLIDEISMATMKLAKKQKTWFKRDPDIHWFHPLNDKQKAQEFIRKSLSS